MEAEPGAAMSGRGVLVNRAKRTIYKEREARRGTEQRSGDRDFLSTEAKDGGNPGRRERGHSACFHPSEHFLDLPMNSFPAESQRVTISCNQMIHGSSPSVPPA